MSAKNECFWRIVGDGRLAPAHSPPLRQFVAFKYAFPDTRLKPQERAQASFSCWGRGSIGNGQSLHLRANFAVCQLVFVHHLNFWFSAVLLPSLVTPFEFQRRLSTCLSKTNMSFSVGKEFINQLLVFNRFINLNLTFRDRFIIFTKSLNFCQAPGNFFRTPSPIADCIFTDRCTRQICGYLVKANQNQLT